MINKLLLLQLKISSFLKREDGATAIEYAIIAGLIAVGIIVAAKALGIEIGNMFDYIAEKLGEAQI